MLIVFDVDGTLVDSREIILAAQAETFRRHGLTMPDERTCLSIVGLSLPVAFARLVGDDAPVEDLTETYKQVFNRLRTEMVHREPLFDGISQLLADLSQQTDVQLGIATGKTRRGVDYLIEHHGWAGLFQTIQTADVAPSKPHPGMLLRAMAETGRPPPTTVMIGDTTFDMEMARRAGCRGIGVAWGHHDVAEVQRSGADEVVATVPDLQRTLAEMAREVP